MHQQEYSLRCSPLRASDERRVAMPHRQLATSPWQDQGELGKTTRALARSCRAGSPDHSVASPCDQCSLPAGVPARRVRLDDTSSVQDKRPPKAQSAHQRPLSQIFRVLLFWQWIRPKVCVDQRPFVALFHKNARRFCAIRRRFSVLVLC